VICLLAAYVHDRTEADFRGAIRGKLPRRPFLDHARQKSEMATTSQLEW